MRALVIAPHPDDEIIGCGGIINKLAKSGICVHVCLVTRGMYPLFDQNLIKRGLDEEQLALKLLGSEEFHHIGLPANGIDSIPQIEVNKALQEVIAKIDPEEVYLPFWGDIHIDHKLILNSAMVALRPKTGMKKRKIYCYEVPSETGWDVPSSNNAFIPNVYVDITEEFKNKKKALEVFESQIPEKNNARSIDAIEALAKFRGSTVGLEYAEALMLVREVK